MDTSGRGLGVVLLDWLPRSVRVRTWSSLAGPTGCLALRCVFVSAKKHHHESEIKGPKILNKRDGGPKRNSFYD